LEAQVQAGILVKAMRDTEDTYWQRYVEDGYRKGAGRAFDDTRAPVKAALDAVDKEKMAFYRGTRAEFLRSAFAHPVSIEKVKLLAGRVFTDLKGVTQAMATTMSRTLTDGLAQGKNPRTIARELNKNIEGIGKRRAILIARTEIIRAHAEGQLDAFERLGVTELGVMGEWDTAHDGRVCKLCEPLQGVVLTVKELRGIIPRHPECRCSIVPANVGESSKGQLRGKRKAEAAIDRSIRAEIPKGRIIGEKGRRFKSSITGKFTEKSKRTLARQKIRSKWAGAGRAIAKKRPKSAVKR
jgi:SPP1 gp7 family putative phage head morphogenesis protein